MPCGDDVAVISPQDSVSIHTRSYRTTVKGISVAGVPYQSCADLPANMFSIPCATFFIDNEEICFLHEDINSCHCPSTCPTPEMVDADSERMRAEAG